MSRLLAGVDRVYDALERRLESVASLRAIGGTIVVVYLAALVVIEMRRFGWLPERVHAFVPASPFHAIDVAFTLVMLVEVVALVLSLAHSVTAAAGKQFEILSLILLRTSFKELADLEGRFEWSAASDSVLHMLSDAGGALAIFLLLGLFYGVKRQHSITSDARELRDFVSVKKLIALLMLAALGGLMVEELQRMALFGQDGLFPFFESFYTVLIFSDILIVLISLRYSSTYAIVFRNSGFAVATVMIRLALAAPVYFNALLGIAAALFALGLLFAYNRFSRLA